MGMGRQASGVGVGMPDESAIQDRPSKLIYLPDAAATRSLGVALGKILPEGIVLLLEGDLGSGKTTLVQGIGEGLGIQEAIDSPTFTLVNEYLDGRLPLYHLDLYRLDATGVAALHPEIYWDGIDVALGIVVIEWAERLLSKPPHCLNIRLTYEAGGRRAELLTQTVDAIDLEPLGAAFS